MLPYHLMWTVHIAYLFQAIYSPVPGSYLYSGSQSLVYRANMSDNGTTILCRVQQSTADGSVLYTSTVQLQLHVEQLIMSQNTAIEERIGIISGIILAIIFIILIFILIAFLLTRRRKVNKQYSSVPDKSQDELLTPIWIPGKGKASRVHVSRTREFVNDYHENGDVQGLSDSEYSRVPSNNTEKFKYSPKLDVSMETYSGESCKDYNGHPSTAGNTLSR